MPRPPQPRAEDLRVFTRARSREVDRLAAEEFGIPSLVLMENAALHVAEAALERLEARGGDSALVVCGPGSNGGDGLAAARHLHNAGVRVGLVLSAPPARYSGDAATHVAVAQRMALPIDIAPPEDPGAAVDRAAERLGRPGLIVDALLGTGLDRPVAGALAAIIERVNELHAAGAWVLAVDLPSGLDADTGRPLGAAVRADATVSFLGLKAGFLTLEAQAYIGEVRIADIGAPRELTARLGAPLPAGARHDEPAPKRRRPPARPPRPARGGHAG